ncbi:RagB/SusD family nutrient uptake outer membrane protein [Cytophagaceae bacterium YF14B1]|uniref:RagB/SusD family nutrient uptake outer membrane protein n=1 Tax=Xanthocytophaga flava TaxID=3048013 RepID=A0AAE3QUC0_9BACT|nr:RagB/SusD family nutrient uptake outer membrane protein [Xanthocytophaga flavus]MDJ1485572.1 RagB/SusD family nutrient uptake outer membrane protein [Xanthocytophaga flavus]
MKIPVIKRFAFWLLVVLSAGFMGSCDGNFLDRPPLSQISADNFYQTRSDLRLATAALYGGAPWDGWQNSGFLLLGDVMGGNMVLNWYTDAVQLNTFSITGQNAIMAGAWASLFNVVAHCNVTIKAIQEKAPNSISPTDKNAAIGEARFIRAMAYYHIAMLWGAVPIIEDNDKLVSNPLVNRNRLEDVYQFIVSDLTFAATHLPASDETGRVSKWSAQGLLAKVYLTLSGLNQNGVRNQSYLDSAKVYAGNVCQNSGLSLLSGYDNLFKAQNNNNNESLFAIQFAPGVGWGQGNRIQTYAPSSEITPRKESPWFLASVSYDLYLLFAGNDSIRRKASFMLPGDKYLELNRAGGGYTASTPVLKKHIIGTETDNNAPTMTLTSSIEANAMLRLADVYLVYAEAILGNNASTSDAQALLYFNKVRERAAIEPVSVIDPDLLLQERRREFAFEGKAWFDLVQLSYYQPQKAVSLLNNQKRVTFQYSGGLATPNDPIGSITPATISTFTLQLPSAEITANPRLLEPPVPYSF